MDKVKQVLIIGGAGFIGSHLIKELLEHTEAKIGVVDDLSVGKEEFIPKSERIIFFKKSILNELEVSEVFNTVKPDVVYHFAARCFLPTCAKDPQGTTETNVVGTEVVVRMCNLYQVKHLVFASSCAVYGISPEPLIEDKNIHPLEVYGLSKLIGETILREYCKIPWTACRFFPVYGNNMTQEYLIPAILKQIEVGNNLLLGNLDTQRDYIHISDVVRSLRMIGNNADAFGEAFNVGFGRAYSGHDIVALFEKAFAKKVTITQDPTRMRKSDNPYICADISKIKKLINWSPEISLEQGLSALLAK